MGAPASSTATVYHPAVTRNYSSGKCLNECIPPPRRAVARARGEPEGWLVGLAVGVGVVLAIGALATTVLDVPLEGGVGDRRHKPMTVAELDDEYRVKEDRLEALEDDLANMTQERDDLVKQCDGIVRELDYQKKERVEMQVQYENQERNIKTLLEEKSQGSRECAELVRRLRESTQERFRCDEVLLDLHFVLFLMIFMIFILPLLPLMIVDRESFLVS